MKTNINWLYIIKQGHIVRVILLLIVCALLSSCVNARQRPPGVAPAEILQGSSIDTAGAQPDDRGVPQPLWPGVPRVIIVQNVDEPPDPMAEPPPAARELCSPWWRAWLTERSTEHPGTADLSGWVDVGHPPPAAANEWWVAWLMQERMRCDEAQTNPAEYADWLGY